MAFDDVVTHPGVLSPTVLLAMASCHTLTVNEGEINGDAMDYQMLKFTRWRLIPPSPENSEYDVVSSGYPLDKFLCLHSLQSYLGVEECPSREMTPAGHGSGGHAPQSQAKSVQTPSALPKKWCLAEFLSPSQPGFSPCQVAAGPSFEPTRCFEAVPSSGSPPKSFPASLRCGTDCSCGVRRDFAIVKVYDFDPALRRMASVVFDVQQHTHWVFSKGSFDTIRCLCKPESLMPSSDKITSYYAQQGFRILALAGKQVSLPPDLMALNALARQQAESGLEFYGFILYTNLPRRDTLSGIQDLHRAGIPTYIATGDNPITAAGIARLVQIIPSSVTTLISGYYDSGRQTIRWTKELLLASQEATSQLCEVTESTTTASNASGLPESFCLELAPPLTGPSTQDTVSDQSFREGKLTLTAHSKKHLDDMAQNDVDNHWAQLAHLVHQHCLMDICFTLTGDALQYLVKHTDFSSVVFRVTSSRGSFTTSSKFKASRPSYKPGVNAFKSVFSGSNASRVACHWRKIFRGCLWPNPRNFIPEESPQMDFDLGQFLFRFVRVYGRMNPDQKSLLVQRLQQTQFKPIVVMCGDGANDCSALKSADVGISLSSNEASVAAPFNSSQKSIFTVIHVLREGRGALSGNVQNFQFVALYSVIQLCSVMILSTFGSYLGDTQFLYVDLLMVLPLVTLMSRSRSGLRLGHSMPPHSLMCASILSSIAGQCLLHIAFQCISVIVLLPCLQTSLYEPTTDIMSYGNTVIFLLSSCQIIISAAILCSGTRPWKRVSRNVSLLTTLLGLALISIALLLNESPLVHWLRHFLELAHLPLQFRLLLLVLILTNIALSVVYEECVIRRFLRSYEHVLDAKAQNAYSPFEGHLDAIKEQNSGRNLKSTCTANTGNHAFLSALSAII